MSEDPGTAAGSGASSDASAKGGGLRPDLVIDALLAEYKNIHQRVIDQVETYEGTNIRILALLGVLFFFAIENFQETEAGFMFFIVNLVLIVLIPLVAIASVLFAAANLCKVMIWGDFLKRVENRVNKVLANEARCYGFERGQVMSWEYWRVAYGYAGKSGVFSVVTFSAFLVVVFVLSSVASVFIRLGFIQGMAIVWYPFWQKVAIGVGLVFAATVWYSASQVQSHRARSMKGACDDATI
jgi:hypothetical protein